MHEHKTSALIRLSDEVRDALASGRAVVALESTIISHGFPYPHNLALAGELEARVREEGAVPATIAVLDGVPHVGLSPEALERLALAEGVHKCSARDLPVVCALGQTGATTVAATCLLADAAGVEVFATGGIGGVHRGAQTTLDISADLGQIARSRVAVVSAGAKAILDLGLTLEVLETRGVTVIGFGCDELPAFYTRTSGHRLPHRIDDVETLARALRLQWALGMEGGALVCNPIPEADALDADEVNAWITTSLTMADEQGIEGKAVTPFLLATLARLSEGRTLPANRALALNNATLAARLAVAMKHVSFGHP